MSITLIINLASCTSNKKIVYLQDETADKPHDALVDKSFPNAKEPWKLEAEDVLMVRINHLSSPGSQISNYTNDDQFLLRTNIQNPNIYGYEIDREGNIDLPIVGLVKVGGLSLEDAKSEIRSASERVFSNPSIKVNLLNFRISVLGDVNRPGQYIINNSSINVFEAISMANDAGEYSNRSGVKIVRTRNGKNHLYHLDLSDENILQSEGFYLQPSDIVIVSPLKRKKWSGREAQSIYQGLGVIVSLTSLIVAVTR
ncbi:MAG: polysaccharide biosynthesis/export family protein [Bacteroidota bacterium]